MDDQDVKFRQSTPRTDDRFASSGDGHPAAASDGREADHVEAADPAQQSLADALRVSFSILKVIMVLLLIAYLFTGVFSVDSHHRAVRLQFGKIIGRQGHQVYGEGWHFGFPYPIEQKIKVPLDPQVVNLTKKYWFASRPRDSGKTLDEMQGGPLDPVKDGSLLTGDANIVHAHFQTTWQITDPAAFARNLGDMPLARRLVRRVAQQGVVFAVAQSSADDVIRRRINTTLAVSRMQHVLDSMHAGITIENFNMSQTTMPLAVRDAYKAVINAQNERARLIEQARQKRTSILSAAAGEAYPALFKLVQGYELARDAGDQDRAQTLGRRIDRSFNQLQVRTPAGPRPIGGEAAAVVSQAKTDRTQVVEQIKQEANSFNSLLAAYHQNPRVVKDRLWQNARQEILTNDVETFYAPTGQLNPVFNRNPAVQRQREKQRLKQQQQQAQQNSENQ